MQVKKTTQFSKVMSAYCKKVSARDGNSAPRALPSLQWPLAHMCAVWLASVRVHVRWVRILSLCASCSMGSVCDRIRHQRTSVTQRSSADSTGSASNGLTHSLYACIVCMSVQLGMEDEDEIDAMVQQTGGAQ